MGCVSGAEVVGCEEFSLAMLTASEVGKLLAISARTVYDIPEDRLPRYRLGAGRGAVRFDPADVEAYRTSCRSAGTPGTSAGGTNLTVSLKAADTDFRKRFAHPARVAFIGARLVR